MEITDVRIMRVDADAKLKAYATVTFDNCFVVHNLKIIDGQTGRFVAMPSRKTKNGDFKDIAHPINSDFRKAIQTRILEEFERQTANGAVVSAAGSRENPAADGSVEP